MSLPLDTDFSSGLADFVENGLFDDNSIENSCTFHSFHNSPSLRAEPATREDDGDVFGFGDFKEMFVTEEDLERAREKLGDEEPKTMAEISSEVAYELSSALDSTSDSPYPGQSLVKASNVVLAVRGHAYAVGKIELFVSSVLFEGQVIDFSKKEEELLTDGNPTAFKFPIETLTGCTFKHTSSPDMALLNITYKDSIFIQFSCKSYHQSEPLSLFFEQLSVLKNEKKTEDILGHTDIGASLDAGTNSLNYPYPSPEIKNGDATNTFGEFAKVQSELDQSLALAQKLSTSSNR